MNVVLASLPEPGADVIEVVAEVSFAGYEELEELRKCSVSEQIAWIDLL